jgi:hypothetical protein
VLPLHVAHDAADDTNTDHLVLRKLDGDIAQEGVAITRRKSAGRLP